MSTAHFYSEVFYKAFKVILAHECLLSFASIELTFTMTIYVILSLL